MLSENLQTFLFHVTAMENNKILLIIDCNMQIMFTARNGYNRASTEKFNGKEYWIYLIDTKVGQLLLLI